MIRRARLRKYLFRKLRLTTTIICSSSPSSWHTAARFLRCTSHPPRTPRLRRPFSNQTWGSHLFSPAGLEQPSARPLHRPPPSPPYLSLHISHIYPPKPPSLRPSPYLLAASLRSLPPPPPSPPGCPSSTISSPRRSSRRTDIPSRTMSIYPPSGMILHPGAHFGDSPTPDSRGHPLGATPNREPAVGAPLSGCFQNRVHWPALTLRHRHPVVSAGTCTTPRVFHG